MATIMIDSARALPLIAQSLPTVLPSPMLQEHLNYRRRAHKALPIMVTGSMGRIRTMVSPALAPPFTMTPRIAGSNDSSSLLLQVAA